MLFLWDTNEGYDAYEDDIKDQLPPVLKTELCYHIYGRVLEGAPFLRWMKDYRVCVKQLAELVKSIFLVDGDTIFRVGQPNEQIYVLISGKAFLSPSPPNVSPNEEDQREPSLENFAAGFSIPRRRTEGLKDVSMSVIQKAKHLSESNMSKAESGAANALHGIMHQTGHKKKMQDLNAAQEKRKRKSAARNFDIFDSAVFNTAGFELMRQDMQMKHYVCLIQRVWRLKICARAAEEQKKAGKVSSGRVGREIKGESLFRSVTRMHSRVMKAPAYFGESCLWVPYEEWGTAAPLPYMYTATAECRCELLYISRGAISAVVEKFSPWLLQRFDLFREAVVEGLGVHMGVDGETTDLTVAKVRSTPATKHVLSDLDWNCPDGLEAEESAIGETKRDIIHRVQTSPVSRDIYGLNLPAMPTVRKQDSRRGLERANSGHSLRSNRSGRRIGAVQVSMRPT